MIYIKIPGILLSFFIAVPAWYIGRIFPLVGGPVIAILMGIIISLLAPNLVKKEYNKAPLFSEGLRFTSRKLLQY